MWPPPSGPGGSGPPRRRARSRPGAPGAPRRSSPTLPLPRAQHDLRPRHVAVVPVDRQQLASTLHAITTLDPEPAQPPPVAHEPPFLFRHRHRRQMRHRSLRTYYVVIHVSGVEFVRGDGVFDGEVTDAGAA